MEDADLRKFRVEHLGRLLAEVHRDTTLRANALFAARRHAGIKPAHIQVFAALPLDGARLTTLAARAGITKQSMGSLVAELESLGYLKREPDPQDGRATWIRFSAKGQRLLGDGVEVMASVESVYASKVGRKRMTELKRTLSDLVAALEIDIPV